MVPARSFFLICLLFTYNPVSFLPRFINTTTSPGNRRVWFRTFKGLVSRKGEKGITARSEGIIL